MLNTIFKIKKTQHTLETNHHSTHYGALIGSNDDLLTEILHRLPVISILRFKSISKHWLSLLSNPHFTLLYDKIPVSPGLFVRNLYISFDVENQNPPPFRKLDFYPDRRGIIIVQSCNGLLLCCSNQGKEQTRNYYIFNPTTKQFAVIPAITGGPKLVKKICFVGLAFHQTGGVYYKVVCIYHAQTHGKILGVQIYSSDTRIWKITDQSFTAPYMNYHGRITYGVYCNGAIHWSTHCLDILYFKLDIERLEKLRLPGRVAYPNGFCHLTPLYFGESRGHMHCVEPAHNDNDIHVNVFEMLTDCSGWFIKYKVELNELLTVYPEMIRNDGQDRSKYWFEVFDVVIGEEDNVENTFMVVRIPGKVIRYNILNKSFEQIFDLPNILFHRRIGQENVFQYIESLSSFE